MNAIYNNRIYNVVDADCDITLDAVGVEPFHVSFDEPSLIVEPTDDEVANASSLAEWYGISAEAATRIRLMLLGEIGIGEWQDASTNTPRAAGHQAPSENR